MLQFPWRALSLATGGAVFALASAPAALHAQTPLPQIVVNAPSAPAGRQASRPRRPVLRVTPAPQPATQSSTGPIGPRLEPTRVAADEVARRGGGTIGDVLADKPGVTTSGFAPGAASRPIIRGLDNNRIGIVEGGTASGGVSDLGEDHPVPIDPLTATGIDILRGPDALRYGAAALGGTVIATNNRIPERLPDCAAPFQGYGLTPAPQTFGRPCATIETRAAFTSVDRGGEGAVLLDAGGGDVAVHAEAFGRRSGDYAIPAYPYLNDPTRAFDGRQPNSFARSDGGAVGGSYLFHGGFVGASVSQFNAVYGIPSLEGAAHHSRIDARQTRVNVKGEYRPDSAALAALRFWASATDYRHNEIGFAEHDDPTTDGVRQTFTNKEVEGRGEVEFAPFNVRFAAITTTIGVHAAHQKLTASSPDDPGSVFNGLFDPNTNTRAGGYLVNDIAFTPTTRAKVGARIEQADLRGATPDFPASYLPEGTVLASTPRHLSFAPKSASVGLYQDIAPNLVGRVTAQYIERAPRPAELFSRGVHEATVTFDIGNPQLRIENARSLEIGLRKEKGPFRFDASAYVTHFGNFIYRRLTGVMCGEDFDSCGNGDPENELRQAVFDQRNALFRGAEWQSQLDVTPLAGGVFGVENQFDLVRATFTDGGNVPRIAPVRAGGGLYWRDPNWLMRVNLLHGFAQTRIDDTAETPTPGYNLLKAEMSYRTALDPARFGAREMHVGLLGNNLLNERIRNAVSFTKDEVLLPGLGVRAFANLKF